jgi:hypothetical protein
MRRRLTEPPEHSLTTRKGVYLDLIPPAVQKRFLGNRGLHLIQEALATRPLLGEELLVVRDAQLEGVGHPFQSQPWIWSDFSWFFRGSQRPMI